MTYLVVQGASVGVIRDGQRKLILPGQGLDFTDEEIATIRSAVPGALRAPVNESSSETEDAPTPGEKAARAPKRGRAKAVAPSQADEDEDI